MSSKTEQRPQEAQRTTSLSKPDSDSSKGTDPRGEHREGLRYIVYLARDIMCFFPKHSYFFKYIPRDNPPYSFLI